MVNLAKPRKVDESKSLLKRAAKNSRKLELKSTFSDILTEFESIVCDNGNLNQADHHVTSNAVRQMLSSLQSLLNKKSQESAWTDEQFENITISTVKCLNGLNILVSSESSFPESITLTALCMAFLLINYFNFFEAKYTNHRSIYSNPILSSCQVYFALFGRSSQIDQSTLIRAFELEEDALNRNHCQINEIIRGKTLKDSELHFRDVALLSGFLNCTAILDLFIKHMVDTIFQVHFLIAKLCSMGMIHEFHVARLMNQYLKVLLDHRQSIEEFCKNKMEQSYDDTLLSLIERTLEEVDNNWESPVSGVGNSVKHAYRILIELTKQPLDEGSVQYKRFIVSQFKSALCLPFTCKSKYKKLSILIQILSSVEVKLEHFGLESSQLDRQVKLCELPFLYDDKFTSLVIQHLSINSLANSIADFYKSSLTSIRDSYKDSSELTQAWSFHWLEAITQIFHDSTLSNSTVVQNTLLAHIFPFTLQNVPNSMPILMKSFSNCSYGQISIVRIFLEKSSQSCVDQLPPRSWLMTMLADADDMARVECLALLVDEKYIHKNRPFVCQLVLHFIKSNINIDNASFRQRAICKLEQFYAKVIISICDRHNANSVFSELAASDQEVVHFVKNTLDFLALSLFPGSSFQRKFTALSVMSSLVAILEKEDKERIFIRFFRHPSMSDSSVPWLYLILLGLVDKDDKIRRLTTEILIQFSKSHLCQYQASTIDFDSLYLLSEGMLKSPRHQESHIGGLLMKYLLRSHVSQLSLFRNDPQPGFKLIRDLVNKTRTLFYSDQYRNDLLCSSKCEPLHGYFLALNHNLTFLSFNDAILSPISSDLDHYQTVLFDGQLRSNIFGPCIQLSLDSLDFFLKLLTPVENSENRQPVEFEEGDALDENTCSPSFFEMCQSIEDIIRRNSDHSAGGTDDVFLSNDYQLILSMCWLNLKENCFLLTTLTSLLADILSLVQENDTLRSHFLQLPDHFYLMSGEEVFQIGSKIVSVMMRCRHKGVIEASAVSLTKFTRTILRVQCYLNSSRQVHPQIGASFRKALESFVGEILDIIDFRQTWSSSVTRRSAGLALIVQAVLVGEAEAIYLDGIRPIKEGITESSTLYDRVVSLLVSIATTVLDTSQASQFVDLPQSNALHVLQSIMGTSALGHLSAKTVEQLFPLCVQGFTSPLWQIRNASLQLFGACITRMLGQKKRVKWSDSEFGTTITFDEFSARYPSILTVIKAQFDSCLQSPEQLHPELVPVLALLASFTPVGQSQYELHSSKQQLVQYLTAFLSNPIWKIRMLAAQSLANLWPLTQFESFIKEWCAKESHQLSCNLVHGLMCCATSLVELKSLNSPLNVAQCRAEYYAKFKSLLDSKQCDILSNLNVSIFHTANTNQQEEIETPENMKIQATVNQSVANKILSLEFLTQIKENVNFKKSDDIRHQFALELFSIVCSFKNATSDLVQLLKGEIMATFVDIVLTLLEDEERDVRMVGQKIVTFLYVERNQNGSDTKREELQALNQNNAIDFFFCWLSSHFEEDQHLVNCLFNRLATMSDISSYPTLFGRTQIYNDQCEFILFEKEEKNVFAEPYIMSIRIGAFIDSSMGHLKDSIVDHHRLSSQIGQSCEQLNQILCQDKGVHLDSLMFLSIWKLPDFLCRLVNLFLVLLLIEKHNLFHDKRQLFDSTLDQIRLIFPFLLTLQSYLQSTDFQILSNQL